MITFSAFAKNIQSFLQVENFFCSLKLYDISGDAYRAESGDLYFECTSKSDTEAIIINHNYSNVYLIMTPVNLIK